MGPRLFLDWNYQGDDEFFIFLLKDKLLHGRSWIFYLCFFCFIHFGNSFLIIPENSIPCRQIDPKWFFWADVFIRNHSRNNPCLLLCNNQALLLCQVCQMTESTPTNFTLQLGMAAYFVLLESTLASGVVHFSTFTATGSGTPRFVGELHFIINMLQSLYSLVPIWTEPLTFTRGSTHGVLRMGRNGEIEFMWPTQA